jgi:hypothetical protein
MFVELLSSKKVVEGISTAGLEAPTRLDLRTAEVPDRDALFGAIGRVEDG